MKSILKPWFMDDITFCVKNCDVLECFRNLKHKHKETRFYSAADFEGTRDCYKEVLNTRLDK